MTHLGVVKMLKKIGVLQKFLSYRDYSNLIIALIENFQLASEITVLILTNQDISTEYVSIIWCSQLIRDLQYYEIQLQISNEMKVQADRYNDRSIMEDVIQTNSSTLTHKRLNVCRLFFRETFLSEISDHSGTKLDKHILTNYHGRCALALKCFPRTHLKVTGSNHSGVANHEFSFVLLVRILLSAFTLPAFLKVPVQ